MQRSESVMLYKSRKDSKFSSLCLPFPPSPRGVATITQNKCNEISQIFTTFLGDFLFTSIFYIFFLIYYQQRSKTTEILILNDTF